MSLSPKPTPLLRVSPLANTNSNTKVKKEKRRRRNTDQTWESMHSVETRDSNGNPSGQSETALMAEMFRTANELEELHKKARRARRRKSNGTGGGGGRRANRRCSAKSKDTFEGDFTDDKSVCSIKSTFSLTNLLSPNRGVSVAREAPKTTTATSSSSKRGLKFRRSLSFTGLTSFSRAQTQAVQPKLLDNLDSSDDTHTHKPKPIPITDYPFQPSYYHDSDDDDDDLILDPEDNLDEFSRQVQKEVMNMTININLGLAAGSSNASQASTCA